MTLPTQKILDAASDLRAGIREYQRLSKIASRLQNKATDARRASEEQFHKNEELRKNFTSTAEIGMWAPSRGRFAS